MSTIENLAAELEDLRDFLRADQLNLRLDLDADGRVRSHLQRRVALLTSRLEWAERAVAVAGQAGTRGAKDAAERAVLDAWRVTGTLVE